MKIHELITFVNNHFEGAVIELLETQYLFLDVPVENAAFDSVHKILNIFYDPANL